MKFGWLIAVILGATTFVAEAADSVLRVSIVGTKPNFGQLLVSVFDSPAAYMKAPVESRTNPVGKDGSETLEFLVAPGDFAVSVVYDEDRDGELTTNFFGIPSEKYGFSNNAKASFGPPSWDHARFSVRLPGKNIIIKLESVE